MTEKKHHNIRYGFSFFSITEDLANLIKNNLINLDAKVNKHYKKKDYVVSFWITDNKYFSQIKKIIKDNNLKEKNYGFRISISTEIESEVVEIPKYIIKLIKEIGGDIQFSYTII